MPVKTSAPPSSRRSARLAGSKPPDSIPEQSKKRETTGEPKSGAKRTKVTTEETETKAEEVEEKKAEAPASAKSTTSGSKVLSKGDKLPKIKLENEEGGEVDVSTLAGDKGLVIFLYPKADTPGCTSQACGFRDHFDRIKELGYEVYGLSKDKPAAQKKWKTKKELNYSLLCDPESKLIKRLGAFVQPNNTKRSHFIFEKGSGKLVDIALGVKPADDPKNCFEFIKKHHA